MAEAQKRNLAQKFADFMAGTNAGGNYLDNAVAGYAAKSNLDEAAESAIRQQILNNPLKGKIPVAEGVDATMSPLKVTGNMLWSNIKAHPGQTAGTALNAAGNIAGLVDDDKLLGQVLGTVGGALLGAKGGLGFGPLGIANTAMLGGNLGMLFDKLRSKKEQDEQYQQQYV